MKENLENFRNEIKELSKNEESLKSISFSKIDDEVEDLTCYFAWHQDHENFSNRNLFRESVKSISKKYGLLFNRRKSTSAKFVFDKIPKEFLQYL